MQQQDHVNRLSAELPRGSRETVDQLLPVVYAELRRVAQRQLRAERSDHTLDATALVHEAYLKLAGLDRMEWRNRAHFFAVAAQAMRRILVDHAVRRSAQKRGGGLQKVPLDRAAPTADRRADELLALDVALDRLESLNTRQSRVVECRFFGGMSIEETADVLAVSPATIKRDWTLARAWLHRELSE